MGTDNNFGGKNKPGQPQQPHKPNQGGQTPGGMGQQKGGKDWQQGGFGGGKKEKDDQNR